VVALAIQGGATIVLNDTAYNLAIVAIFPRDDPRHQPKHKTAPANGEITGAISGASAIQDQNA